MIRARWPIAVLVPSALALAAFDDPPAKPATPTPPAAPLVDDDEDVIPEDDADPRQSDRFSQLGRQYMDKLDAEYGKGFFTYFFNDDVMPRPYLVAAQSKSNVDPETLEKEYAEILGYLYKEFFRQYQKLADMKDVVEPVPVLVFGSRDDYKKVREEKPELGLVNEEFVAGYYIPSEGLLVQWRQEDLWHVMFHEGTHQLVDFATGRRRFLPSPWFSEGIADFMGGHKSKLTFDESQKKFIREFQLGRFLQGRFSAAQTAIQGKRAMTVKELVGMDFIAFKQAQNNQEDTKENFARNREITGLVYAQGWTLVKFLNDFEGGKYKPLFNEFFRQELKGNGNLETFGEIFLLETDEEWDEFNAEYTEYVQVVLRRERLIAEKDEKAGK